MSPTDIAAVLDTAGQVLVPIIVAVVGYLAQRMRRDNARDHSRVVERLSALEATTASVHRGLGEGIRENRTAIRQVGDKVDGLSTQVVLNNHRIHSLEETI